MARRPDASEFDRPLTREQISQLYQQLVKQAPFQIQHAYREAYDKCRLHGELSPKAAAIQELVTAWKALRVVKRRRPQRRD